MAHAEVLFPVLSEPALYDFIDEAPPASVQALQEKLARSESRKSPDGSEHWLNWVVRSHTGHVVGYVQATVGANQDTHVAYAIGSAFWGQGLATEAVSQMLRIVAAEHNVTRFFILAERKNIRSVRVAERLGFVEVPSDEARRRSVAAADVLLQKRWAASAATEDAENSPH
jgi:[ribosomal protein S5]-alanine N-acetyltransferase